jgi:hypothetical protein
MSSCLWQWLEQGGVLVAVVIVVVVVVVVDIDQQSHLIKHVTIGPIP